MCFFQNLQVVIFRDMDIQRVSENALQRTEYGLQRIAMTNVTLQNYSTFTWMKSTRIHLEVMDIKRITRNSFHGLRDVEELRLLHLNLTHVDGRDFGGLENLKHLVIENCPLENLSGISKLRHLDQLRLKKVLVTMITYSNLPENGTLRSLSIVSSSLVHLFKNCSSENCEDLDPINALMNSSQSCSVTNYSTQIIDFSNNNIDTLPSGVFRCFPSLRTLILNKNLIKGPYKHSFLGLRCLENLYLSDNKITFISRGTFQHLSGLKILSLKNNIIQLIDSGSICPLPINGSVDPRKPAATLTVLNANNNNISLIEEDALYCLASVRTLVLSKNGMTSLRVGVFKGLGELSSLIIGTNAISHIKKGVFDALYKLSELRLSKNEIRVLNDEAFHDLFRLSSLNLEKNALSVLQTGTFIGLRNLKLLNLADNKISFISSDSLRPLNKLVSLSLNNNQIKSVHPDAFSTLTSLHFLIVSNNKITVPTREMFQVTVLNFLNNPLLCTCDLYWTKQVAKAPFSKTICSNKQEKTVFEYFDKFCCKFEEGVCTQNNSHAATSTGFEVQMNTAIIIFTGGTLLLWLA